MNFKVGDRVKRINEMRGNSLKVGEIAVIIRLECWNYTWGAYLSRGDPGYWHDFTNLELISESKSIMSSITDKIKLLAKAEPHKSIIKAGLRTANDEFTSEGKEAFLEFLYQKHAEEFKTSVADLINTEKK